MRSWIEKGDANVYPKSVLKSVYLDDSNMMYRYAAKKPVRQPGLKYAWGGSPEWNLEKFCQMCMHGAGFVVGINREM